MNNFIQPVEYLPLLEINSDYSYSDEFFLSSQLKKLEAHKTSLEEELCHLNSERQELKDNTIYKISKIGRCTLLFSGSALTTTTIFTAFFNKTATGIIAQVSTGIFLILCYKAFPFFFQKWAGSDIFDQIREKSETNVDLKRKLISVSEMFQWASDIDIFFQEWEIFSQNPSLEAIPTLIKKFNKLTLFTHLGIEDYTLFILEITFSLKENEQELLLREYKISKEDFNAFCKERKESIIEVIKKRYQDEFADFLKEDNDTNDEAIELT